MESQLNSESSSSLLLLDSELLDYNSDVFDPPAWKTGRCLQFADISLEDEPSIRPLSRLDDTSRSSSFSSAAVPSGHERLMTHEELMTQEEDELMTNESFVTQESMVMSQERLMTHERLMGPAFDDEDDVVEEDLLLVTSQRSLSSRVVWSSLASRSSFVVQMDGGHFSSRHLRLTRRSALLVTSCVSVALTALTFLTFALY